MDCFSSKLDITNVFVVLSLIAAILLSCFVTIEPTSFVDIWALSGFAWQFVTITLVLATGTYILYKNNHTGFTLIFPLVLTSLIVLIPLVKYSSPFHLYGSWDSLAHFSFAKWIMATGHVPSDGEVYYSYQYAYHAGNGILPASISLISGLPLDISMNILLVGGYWVYVLILYKLITLNTHQSFIITCSLLSIPLFYPYYTGSSIAFPLISLIAYTLYPFVMTNRFITFSYKLLFIIGFLGLLVTHFSTATILTLTMTIVFGLKKVFDLLKATMVSDAKDFKNIYPPWVLALVIYLFYELFVDYVLMAYQITSFYQIFHEFYVYELYLAMQEKPYTLPFLDRVWNYIVTYPKEISILILLLLQIILLLYESFRNILYKRRVHWFTRNTLIIFVSLSFLPILITWGAVGRTFTASVRFLNVSQFFIVLGLYQLLVIRRPHNKLKKTKKISVSAALKIVIIMLIILNYISNYGLVIFMKPYPFGNEYTYTNFQNGVVSPLVLSSIFFINRFNTTAKFVIVEPLIPYGYSDLMWGVTKLPAQGHLLAGPTPENVIETINRTLMNKEEYIFPFPLDEGVVPAYLGYESYYVKPFYWSISKGGQVIYCNKFYSLVLLGSL